MVASTAPGDRPTPSAFGHLLKRLRVAADLTQEELAERASVSARLVSDLERGLIRRPRRDTIRLLADSLGLTGSQRDVFTALARGSTAGDLESSVASSQPQRVRPSLPHPPTPLVGRTCERAEAMSLLADQTVQLLTLTGPGGVGKTRLAVEIATTAATSLAATFPDGAFFIDLTPVRDPDLVLQRIARVLHLTPGPGQPLQDYLVDSLLDKRILLVLDNVEHIVAVAPAIADLLSACPNLAILATSRIPLKIRAEREYRVDPLPLPDLARLPSLDELAHVPAVDLFLRRGAAAMRDFTLTAENARAIAEITVRLDGLPLAIELAAARLKVLSPEELLARLERRLPLLTGGPHDLPDRLQAMSAAIAWSYDLLTSEHQRLLRRLAIFVGGFTLPAAEATTRNISNTGYRVPPAENGSSSPAPRATRTGREGHPHAPSPISPLLDALAVLVDQSLLVVRDGADGERRFFMLETIREYCLERLELAGEIADAKERHTAWCVDLAERIEPELTGSAQDHWCAVLDREHGNLRAALIWAVARHDAPTALRLSGALWRYWQFRGLYDEGRTWIERALAIDDQPTTYRAAACRGGGRLAFRQGDLARADALNQEALAIDRALNNRSGIAASLGGLGLVAHDRGDFRRAAALYEEALTIYHALGDHAGIGRTLNSLGALACNQGDNQRSAALHEQALAIRRATGDQDGIAYSLCNLAYLAYAAGDVDRAAALFEEGLILFKQVGNHARLIESLEEFALIAMARGLAAKTARLLAAADTLRTSIGVPVPPTAVHRADLARVRTLALHQLGPDAFTAAWQAGQQIALDQALSDALNPDASA